MSGLRAVVRRLGEGPLSDAVLTLLLLNAVVVLASDGYTLPGLGLASPSPAVAVALPVAWAGLRLAWTRRGHLGRQVWQPWLRAHDVELALALLLGVGLGIRLWGLDFGAPLVVHPDEHQVAGKAISMLKQGWIDPSEPYVYPTVFPYLLLPAFGLYYVRGLSAGVWESLDDLHHEEFGFYLVARAHSAVLGTLTILLVYLVARRLWAGDRGRWIGLTAAALLTFSFNHVRESHYAVTDAAMTFFLALALLAIIGVYQRGTWRQYTLAGFLVGIACATKYNALPIAVVLVAAHLLGRPAREWAAPRLAAGIGAIPLGFFTGYPYALLNWPPFLDHLGKLGRFTGSQAFDAGDRLGYLAFYSMESGLGWLFSLVLAVAIVSALHHRRREELLLLTLLVATVVVLTHSSHRFFPRYLLPLLPAAALLVGGMVVEGAERARQAAARRGLPRWLAAGAGGVVMLLMVWPQAAESIALDRYLALPDTRAQAAEYLVRRFEPGATVASEADYLRLPHDYRLLSWRPIESAPDERFLSEGVDAVVLTSARDRRAAAARRDALRARLTPLRTFAPADGVATGPTISIYLHQHLRQPLP